MGACQLVFSGLAMEWAEIHKDDLMENWNSIQITGKYNKIKPLV